MKTLSPLCFAAFLLAALAQTARCGPIQWNGPSAADPMSMSAFDGKLRMKLSGLLDLETYYLPDLPPGLIFTEDSFLLNPRLSVFLDGQVGSKIYFFTQSRVDRGFDPGDGDAQVRLDEYAVRFTPFEDGRFSFQIGRFATVVGNWTQRHLSWDNPFINAPLPYDNLTGIWDGDAVESSDELLAWGHVPTEEYSDFGNYYYADKILSLPVIWGPSYASGASVAGRIGSFEYAAEMKNSSLSSRPESWDATQVGFEHPTFSGRIGYRPDMAWNVGLSLSSGAYLHPDAEPTLPSGKDIGDYQQRLIGQDIRFEWHHWQIGSEIYAARFEVPNVGNADTLAYYIEARYKFTPQFFGALRWNQQFFSKVSYDGEQIPWGRDISRLDVAFGYRFTTNTQFKFQYSILDERWAESDVGQMVAGQFTLKF